MEGLEALIPVINKLQDVFSKAGITNLEAINLPQIIVVGAQSAGKSSVLESLVGRDFLPRGQGLVTRLPLVLQLIHWDDDSKSRYGELLKNIPGSSGKKEFGLFLHDENKLYTSFDDVRKEINDETDRVMGKNKGIGSKPINLRIFSESVVNLTLVDLPGLTKNPVGDQPRDIEDQITKLIMTYIKNPNSLILAVTPANVDMATSEALKLAKAVDPEGKRTLAVITKLDLMDKGTDARDVLSGGVIPVKLGIIGVVNRSQQDINTNKAILNALKDEKTFLMKHYSELAHQHGTIFLSRTLNNLLMSHIRDRLPDLKEQISKLTLAHKNIMEDLGQPVTDKEGHLIRLITEFVKAYSSTVDGTSVEVDANKLKGGAMISVEIFQNIFQEHLFAVEALDGLELKNIVLTLRGAAGLYPPLTVPDMAFRTLAKDQIGHMLQPCLECVDLVYEEMQRIIQRCGKEIQREFQKYPKFCDSVLRVVNEFIKQQAESTRAMVKYLVDIEVSYINTKHPDFCDEMESLLEERSAARAEKNHDKSSTDSSNTQRNGAKKAPLPVQPPGYFSPLVPPSRGKNGRNKSSRSIFGLGDGTEREANFLTEIEEFDPGNIPPREMEDVELMKTLVTKYFAIVQKTIFDIVPKAIVHSLIETTKDELSRILLAKLYAPGIADKFEVLNEAKHITEQRNNTMAMLEALQQASKIISEVRDLSAHRNLK
ncbi:dynamin-1-like protein [Paramacrobiotus metropolitanus]|uniref:dynamin-1-like protein n=1 Tax=Paramacrobiotus metropolitanus TaxID=2943436 RepID=UPI00244610F5|nr:dynamin-1-like protein [Paramacrobiotus metropolitanus]XP_055332809.1 dynamin-1-like protein [Paramacrobiotus metropolitanus]